MKIQRLSVDEARRVYTQFLTKDFPPDERKPFFMIERAMIRNEYICCAATVDGNIQAYAFFVVLPGPQGSGPHYLFDYYAVVDGLRGTGIGSSFMQALLKGPLKDAACVMVEIENPFYAGGREERAHCERRQRFYEKNGLVDTGVDVRTFGVEFRLLEAPPGRPHSQEEIKEIYGSFYRGFLPGPLYRRMIMIRG